MRHGRKVTFGPILAVFQRKKAVCKGVPFGTTQKISRWSCLPFRWHLCVDGTTQKEDMKFHIHFRNHANREPPRFPVLGPHFLAEGEFAMNVNGRFMSAHSGGLAAPVGGSGVGLRLTILTCPTSSLDRDENRTVFRNSEIDSPSGMPDVEPWLGRWGTSRAGTSCRGLFSRGGEYFK
jgi:hypothetical protein